MANEGHEWEVYAPAWYRFDRRLWYWFCTMHVSRVTYLDSGTQQLTSKKIVRAVAR